jgi:uncharacterized phage infection (PIP) family protein YhgE
MIAGLQVGLALDSAEFKKGADEAKKKAQELAGTFESTSAQTKNYSSALNDAANAKKNFQYNLRNIGYQVQDFSTQVAAGTSAAQALTQQLPQLLSGFGTMGVVLGALAAVGIPLVTAGITKLIGDIKGLDDATKGATDAATQFIEANNKAALSLSEIAESYHKEAGPALMELYDQLLQISKLKLTNEIKEFAKAVQNEYAPMWKLALPEIFNLFRDSPVEKLAKDLGISEQEATRLFSTLRKFEQGQATSEELRDAVIGLKNASGEATKEGLKLREQLLRVITAYQEAADAKTDSLKKAEKESEKAAKSEADRAKAYIESLDAQIRKLREGEDAALRFEAAKYGGEASKKAETLIGLQAGKRVAEDVTKPNFLDAFLPTKEQMQTIFDELKGFVKEESKDFALSFQAPAGDTPSKLMGESWESLVQAAEKIKQTIDPLRALEKEVETLDKLFYSGLLNQKEYLKAVDLAFENFTKKHDPLKELLEDLRDGFKSLGAEIVDAFMKGSSAAQAFKNIAQSLFQRFATRALNRFIDSMLPGGSSFAGLFRAEGGPVASGRPYIVGEQGPELFVPKASGTIVPNGGFSGGGTVVNYNIQAIDVKSFEDRIMGSNRAVWAANAYAQKSLSPRGRA